MNNKILDIKKLSFNYRDSNDKSKWKEIFKNINISIDSGKIIGIVGKSGCGKTTLAKAIVNYFHLSNSKEGVDYKINGDIIYYHDKNDACSIRNKDYLRIKPPPIQMVFQDPRTSLNMNMNLRSQLEESVRLNKKNNSNDEIDNEIEKISKKFKIYDQVKMKATPRDLSGGQRRRFGLAKIICSNPKLIIADEPVSSLDVSVKKEIMNVLFDLNNFNKGKTSIVVISHDISLLKENADLIYVMDKGRIVEEWNPSEKPKTKETMRLVNDSNFINSFVNQIQNINE